MTRGALRLVAFAIAVAGVVDPSVEMSGAARSRLAVVATEPASAEARGVRDMVAAELARSYDVVAHLTSDAAAAIVVGDRYPEEPLPETLLVATMTVGSAAPSGARVVRVNAPREVPPATAIHLEVDVEAPADGASTDLTARIAGLEVARVTHRWPGDRKRWRALLDVVPVGDPPWLVRVAADPPADTVAGSSPSASVDVAVDLRRTPLRVMFYEPRPSWATTFVRRALEADARFEVAALSFNSRGLAARTGDAAAPTDPRIDAAEVLVVGGLDRLSTADVRALERFMRDRGGAVVLVPDSRIDAGPARDLLFASGGPQMNIGERLLERPAKLSMAGGVAPLEASELLAFAAPSPGADVVATTGGADAAPVIVSTPYGTGRLFVSGAMDAWRYRADDNAAFDRFWQSATAGLALAVPPPIDVAVTPVVRPLSHGEVVVRVRSREYAALTATLNGDQPIRLRPEPEAGVFRGRFTAPAVNGRSTIAVRAGGATEPAVSRTVIVQADAGVPQPALPLSMLAASHRGINATPDRVADLERFLRGAITVPHTTVVRRPMRSPWWILPFAACLCGEWWLRRRRGLR